MRQTQLHKGHLLPCQKFLLPSLLPPEHIRVRRAVRQRDAPIRLRMWRDEVVLAGGGGEEVTGVIGEEGGQEGYGGGVGGERWERWVRDEFLGEGWNGSGYGPRLWEGARGGES